MKMRLPSSKMKIWLKSHSFVRFVFFLQSILNLFLTLDIFVYRSLQLESTSLHDQLHVITCTALKPRPLSKWMRLLITGRAHTARFLSSLMIWFSTGKWFAKVHCSFSHAKCLLSVVTSWKSSSHHRLIAKKRKSILTGSTSTSWEMFLAILLYLLVILPQAVCFIVSACFYPFYQLTFSFL